MTKILRYFLLSALLAFCCVEAGAQTMQTYKVKKKETIYGIARDHGISVEDLMRANPGMESPDYKLKKGSIIYLPTATSAASATTAVVLPKAEPAPQPSHQSTDVRKREIRLGVMLPLHKVNNDGRRMVEYYRGILMACDSLKKEGISIDVHAWNLAEDGHVDEILKDPAAARCDVIIGPLYSKFVPALSDFVKKHRQHLVIPFFINAGQQLASNPHIFQVYQAPGALNDVTARRAADWFKDCHPVIVDCGDTTSTKGPFTAALRRIYEARGVQYGLTSSKSSDTQFAYAFVKDRPNVVILNSSGSRELNVVFGKLSALIARHPEVQLAVFGYTEWMMYTHYQQQNFYRYNVYIPAPFHTNLQSPLTERLMHKYRWNFRQDMMNTFPRFGLTGFDHAMFFLRGLHKYGMSFDGAAGRFGYQPSQTPLKFERVGEGGYQNRAYLFIHYKPDHTVETVNY